MEQPDYHTCSYTLRADAPSEDIWAQAQANNAYISFNGFGDVVITIDSRNPYISQFVLAHSEWIARTQSIAYYKAGPNYAEPFTHRARLD